MKIIVVSALVILLTSACATTKHLATAEHQATPRYTVVDDSGVGSGLEPITELIDLILNHKTQRTQENFAKDMQDREYNFYEKLINIMKKN